MGDKKAASLFMEDGNFINRYDPYRRPQKDNRFFDEDGWPTPEVLARAEYIVHNMQVSPMCDAAKLVHACRFSSNTKMSYSPVYMWK